MTRWRLAIAFTLGAVVGLPLALPVIQLLAEPQAWRAWLDAPRLLALGQNTLLLIAGTLALCMPVGVLFAVFLFRTDLPLHRTLRGLVLLTLFVPLPLFASGWQAALGSGGWLSLASWNALRPVDPAFASGGNRWMPWGQGIGTAVWVHTMAGLPWVVWLVGRGLCWVDRELEEDALMAAGPVRVLARVSLPRVGASIAAAALWVALQTATEITVTDVMQVRTFAEEVYTQLVVPDLDGAAGPRRALAVSLPATLLVAGLVLAAAWRWKKGLPPMLMLSGPPARFHLGRWRWPAGLLVASGVALLIGVPTGSLIWRAGLAGAPPSWSPSVVIRSLLSVLQSSRGVAVNSLLVAATVGTAAATLALLASWTALDSRGFRAGVLVLMALAWATPGPVVGLGLKAVIDGILDGTGPGHVADLLYYGPSSAPVVWVDVVRFFPCAMAVVWPAMRLLPAELREAARLEGAGLLREFAAVIAPLTARVWLRAALAVEILAMGEVSAGKLVSTAGKATWAHQVFTAMHFGVTNDLAARCLLLLAAVGLAGSVLLLSFGRAAGRRPRA